MFSLPFPSFNLFSVMLYGLKSFIRIFYRKGLLFRLSPINYIWTAYCRSRKNM